MKVFLSYASDDYFFAEMLSLKLKQAKIDLWRDLGRLRAGDDWKKSIEKGVFESDVVVVALSARSSESPYVTYEWAYALGQGKAIIPVKLTDCALHPRLESIQYIDFSYPLALPWKKLLKSIRKVETEQEEARKEESVAPVIDAKKEQAYAEAILEYLTKRGYRVASFDRLRRRVAPELSNEMLDQIIRSKRDLFRSAKLKGGKRGIARHFI